MIDWIIGGIVLLALILAARHVVQSFSGGGCSSCPGGCPGCSAAKGHCVSSPASAEDRKH